MPHAKELRVFISSTFHDLQAERDYLLKNVFPGIRHMCRERGVEFTEIDLRWGLTEEEAVLGRLVRSCLEEIDRCRPYFIGILGTRYGWTPPLHEVQKDGDLLRHWPWIEDAVMEGQSLCELEFRHGVLHAPPAGGAIVVHRESVDTDPTAERVRRLRDEVAAHGSRVRAFATPEELGATIRRHLQSIIERDFPADAFGDELHDARRGHEAFASSRRRAYIAHAPSVEKLARHAESQGPPLVVVAPSGYGKSALLAYWTDWYKRKHPDTFVITHFVGVGSDTAGVLRHVALEIKDRLGLPDAVPDSVEQLEQEFPAWLTRIAGTGAVIVIDAVNQLGGGGLPAWLPRFVPERVRLIVSTTPGVEADELASRGWEALRVDPLPPAEREAMIVRFLGEYHKGLSAEQCKRIAAVPNAAIPLFLRTLLEELRLFGSFDALDAGIDHYLAAPDLGALFQLVLERFEQDHGREIVRNTLVAVWAARRGLREEEIAGITHATPAAVASLMQTLEYHMLWRDGLRTFFHEYLRDAVESRYLTTQGQRNAAHVRLAEYFGSRPIDARRAAEEPWQWREAHEWRELHDCIVSIPMFGRMYSIDNAHELYGYWLAMGDRFDMVSDYTSSLERYFAVRPDKRGYARLCNDLGNYLLLCSRIEAADTLLSTAHQLAAEEYGNEAPKTMEYLRDVGTGAFHRGLFDKAEQAWRTVLAVQERTLTGDDVSMCENLDQMTALLYQRGRYQEAEVTARKSLVTTERSLGADHLETANRRNNLASVLTQLQRLDDAHWEMERAIATVRNKLGERHPEVGRLLNNLAVVGERLRGTEYAESLYRSALGILLPTVGEIHEYPCHSHSNLATLFARSGRFEEAEAEFERGLRACKMLYDEGHPYLLHVRCEHAAMLAKRGLLTQSAAEFREVLPLRCKTEGESHPKCREAIERFVSVLNALDCGEEATAWLARARRGGQIASINYSS